MNKLWIAAFLVLSLGVGTSSFAEEISETQAEAPEAAVAPQAFFTNSQGDYKVLLVAGEKPKESNAVGGVSAESGEGTITLSYCPPEGGCDAGYVFFPYDKTQIQKQTASDGRNVYTLIVTEDGTKSRYTWEEVGTTINFTNYQYEKPNGKIVTLVHVIQKLHEE